MAHARQLSASGAPSDLTNLINAQASQISLPSEDTITSALQQRFRADLPYSRISSTTLLVVNPIRTLANLNDASAEDYRKKTYADSAWEREQRDSPDKVLPPHPYELAGRVYHMMRRTQQSQAVVFNGVTDSGKSFASKLFTNQLLRHAASANKQEHKLAEQVRALDTILNSFGAAKTRANSNASRFGKYLELHFSSAGRLAAAKVLTFGLDKSRLTSLASEERTFHVFYQLLAGATHEERETYKLDDVTSYDLLASSGCYRLPGGPSSDDNIAMDELRAAMKTLGFKQKHVQAIFTLVSAILMLGNIQFSDHDGHDATFESAHVTNPQILDDAADLLGVSSEDLSQALTNKSRFVRKELITSFLNAECSRAQRDNLMRDLYATLFAFVVETANHKLAPGPDDPPTTQIVQLDLPGVQTRASPRSSGSSLASVEPCGFHDFTFNFAAECLQNWLHMQDFDQSSSSSAQAAADGVDVLDALSGGDNSACVELLRGSITGTAATDRKPAGILGALDKAVNQIRAGKAKEDEEDAFLTELDSFMPYSAFVHRRSQALASQTASSSATSRFGINHYQGPCTYQTSGFLAHQMDALDSAFVSMLRASQVSFIARLFAGPSLATESHPLEPTTIVSAQVSVRPLRQPSSLIGQDEAEPLLDPSKPYGFARQVNASLSEILSTISQAGQVWSVLCIRPNDISQPGSFDARRVKAQVKALSLTDQIAKKRVTYVQSMELEEFCQRYQRSVYPAASAVGVSEPREQIQAFSIANAWRESVDYAVGNTRIWLTYNAWRRLEDRLRTEEPDEVSPVTYADQAEPSSYPPGQAGFERSASFLSPMGAGVDAMGRGTSEDDLLAPNRRPSEVSNPFGTPGETGSVRALGEPPVADGWGKEWDQRAYGDINPALGEKAGEGVPRAIDAVEEVPITAIRRWWVRFVWLFTWWIPGFMLSSCGGMKRPDVQMAWREKVTICGLIFLACATILFYILVFGKLICPDSNKAWNPTQLSTHAGEDDYYSAIAGSVYDFSKFYKRQHSDIANLPVDDSTMLQLAGLDLTPYFPVPLTQACRVLVTDPTFTLSTNSNLTATITQAVHTSGATQADTGSKLSSNTWYFDRLQPFLKQYWKGYYVYDKKQISDDSSWRNWAIVDGKVYDLTNYLYTVETSTGSSSSGQNVNFLDSGIVDLFKGSAGEDITKDFNSALGSLNGTYGAAQQNCLDNAFYVGKTDFRKTARCQVQNYLLLAFSILLMVTIGAKFLAALQLTTKRNPEQQDKFVICQVPCYTEGEDELRKTIDSLAGQKYDDKRKLMFIICDGMIVGSGNETPTPRIVLDILGVDPKIDPEPLMFKSIAEGSKQLNYGKVYSGLYEFEGHVVPYIVVVKCGRPSERTKPGNRGKRDTQILLMRYLNRVHFDAPMYPLELEIYHQMKNVIGIDPAFYEYILMVDADTSVDPDGLNRLVAVAADDSRIIAVCGETTLDNEEGSWWTMIQVYEYYISHHLAKAFESLFGSVTCLPGCFSMYRIRSQDKGRPLFISNRIIDDYSENKVDTLHKKNLFSLGEDRYLTTLILKHFPSFRTKFTQDAKAHTAAPDRFGILLSQRRRWINSTVHNLAELILMPELCGFCLFSMRFIVFIDLLGTIILPATVIYLIYLIVSVATGQGQFPIISIVMIAAVYGLQVVIFLLKRQWQYIGWLLIYLLAYPIYSFFLPVYSFWHMDDFSWGNTRIVVGEKGNKRVIAGTDDEPYDDSMIPLKKFSEYQRDVWDQGGGTIKGTDAQSMYSGANGSMDFSPFAANPFAGSKPGSMYKSPSYAGSAAGSEYGRASGDFYQQTNILDKHGGGNHSRNSSAAFGGRGLSRPASMAFGNAGRTPSMSMLNQAGMGQGGMTPAPSGSMWGMPAMGSMYGMPGTPSMYGMPGMGGAPSPGTPFGQPGHQASPSQSDMGFPGLGQRSSMMPIGAQMTGQGGAPQLPGIGSSPATNPFAASPRAIENKEKLPVNENPNPSDDDLKAAIISFLGGQSDLYSVTKRQVRTAVEESFTQADLKSKKAVLNGLIDQVLRGQS
ncbi:unnamed protein product [Sympodiomycopsis kandeliae]